MSDVKNIECFKSNNWKKKMLDEGRVDSGGMHKMEPKALANVPTTQLSHVLEKYYQVASLDNLNTPPNQLGRNSLKGLIIVPIY